MSEKELILSPRLAACADFVPPGTTLIDVGTDHAYLPIWLVQHGRVTPPVIAADVNEGPLERARHSAEEYGVTQALRFHLGDGLSGLAPDAAQTVVIAGMGGESIARVLHNARWAWSGEHTLVLQPMTKIAHLCLYLYENSFYAEKNRLVRDAGTIYRVLCVKAGNRPLPGVLELYTGELDAGDPLSLAYLRELLQKFRRALQGLERSKRKKPQTEAELRELIARAEETERRLLQA